MLPKLLPTPPIPRCARAASGPWQNTTRAPSTDHCPLPITHYPFLIAHCPVHNSLSSWSHAKRLRVSWSVLSDRYWLSLLCYARFSAFCLLSLVFLPNLVAGRTRRSLASLTSFFESRDLTYVFLGLATLIRQTRPTLPHYLFCLCRSRSLQVCSRSAASNPIPVPTHTSPPLFVSLPWSPGLTRSIHLSPRLSKHAHAGIIIACLPHLWEPETTHVSCCYPECGILMLSQTSFVELVDGRPDRGVNSWTIR